MSETSGPINTLGGKFKLAQLSDSWVTAQHYGQRHLENEMQILKLWPKTAQ